MRHFEAKHWAILAALVVAVGTQLAGVAHGWMDVGTPTFIGGTLISIGTTIGALFTSAPTAPKE